MLSVLRETQKQRDEELARYLKVDTNRVRACRITDRTGPAIHTGGDLVLSSFNHLYSKMRGPGLPLVLKSFLMFIAQKRGDLLLTACKMIGDLRGLKVLDFGCGVGSHGIHMLQYGARVDFLDVDGPAYQFCRWRVRERGLKNAGYLFPGSHLEPKKYDVVLMIDVMEHVADPMAEFDRVTAACKRGGFVVLQVGMKLNPKQGHFKQSKRIWVGRKCKELRRKRLLQIDTYYFIRK